MDDENKIDDENNDYKIEIIKDKPNDIDNDKLHKLHNGNPILNIQVTPNEKYFITCGRDGSIFGWNVENVNEDGRLRLEFEIYLNVTILNNKILYGSIFSDNKKAVTFGHEGLLNAYDMNNNSLQKIELDLNYSDSNECSFNLNDELISYYKGSRDNKGIIFVYSTQTNDNKWDYKRIYRVPEYTKVYEGFKIISVTKYNKLYYMISKETIYEFDLITEKTKKIWVIDEEIRSTTFNVKIVSNENLVGLKIGIKIIIYSIKEEIPIVSLDIKKNVDQLRTIMKSANLCSRFFPLLFSLFSYETNNNFWNSLVENFWIKCIDHLKQNDKLVRLPIEYFLMDIRVTNEYAFAILDVGIWRIDLNKMISSINSLFNDEIEDENSIFLHNPYMDDISKLFQEVKSKLPSESATSKSIELIRGSRKWAFTSIIYKDYETIGLRISEDSVFNPEVYCERYDKFKSNDDKFQLDNDKSNLDDKLLYGIKISKEGDIIVLTQIGLLIYHYDQNNEVLSLIYYYYMKLSEITHLQYYEKVFSIDLPLPNATSYESCDGWISYVEKNIDNKEIFLKYGIGLLTFAIKRHKVKLIGEIYDKCMEYFKNDFSNKIPLSIITSMMPLLNQHYPEYIEKYSSDTTMIIPYYYTFSFEYYPSSGNSHLFSFKYSQIDNLSRSLLYRRYQLSLDKLKKNHKNVAIIFNFIQYLLILLILPIYFVTFYILSKFHFFNNMTKNEIYSTLYFKVVGNFSNYNSNTPMLIFLNPYIKFVNYPKDYKWYKELIKPQPSPFVETINENIYKSWSGEALINFKWNTYGKYYYAVIWILFMAYLGCFTAAATIPQQYIDKDVHKRLLITSIILGFIHLSFEIRQIIYDFGKWIRDFWNMFDVIAYVLPIITSIIWLRESDIDIIPLLSFSCLFLDIKFLLFFRALEYFGVYFAIIISVAETIISFLVVLFIIIVSFAHAFYILLIPRTQFSFAEPPINNNDQNNPWNIVNSYYQVLENGNIGSSPYIIQQPNENTNMFIDFRTAIFAMYKFLTGDSSAVSNWPYTTNPSLSILIVLFSLLIVVYLMNLLIGLLNNAIEKKNNRVSYLIQKAEILAEIELFYLLPLQRRWNKWFPEVIYYYANADKTREKIKELVKNDEWNNDIFSESRKSLLKELNIEDDTDKSIDEDTLQKSLAEMKENLLKKFNEDVTTKSVDKNTLQKTLEEMKKSLLKELNNENVIDK
ncbi:hypothetical protein RclHR1_01470011 [Rhizophagus clarus]|uniref:Ion transport domain-containing protein n=1 Tax=Rhizophagus clarus TaxID=94130 RepID=A0A2Z6QDD2_9GLOM|nr:hypothetical protein RclHR1_01470011 [Rhizophagus clarus]GES84219.1 hypothetical protein GLOIN_2v1537213 [Rhizophagus clarus]